MRGDAKKSVTLIGIEPEKYIQIIALDEKFVAGKLSLNSGEAVLGIELAKDLGAGVGDKVWINTVNDINDTLTITGLFDLGNKGINGRNVYVGLRSAQMLLDLVGGVSSIDLSLRDIYAAETVALKITGETGLQADSWIKTNAQYFFRP